MGINTVPHRPSSPDFAPFDIWLFPKLTGCHYETIEEMKEAVTKVIDTLTQEDFLPEVVAMVQQVHWSRRRLLRRGLEFHVCTINKSAHTKKSLETYLMILVLWLFVGIFISNSGVHTEYHIEHFIWIIEVVVPILLTIPNTSVNV